MGLLWGTLGWSALIAAALCILIMLPLQFLIAKAMAANSKLLLVRDYSIVGCNTRVIKRILML